jgi:hypothetical protein
MVRKRGSKWVVVSHTTGEVLGTHDTPGEAYAQLAAFKHSKKRRKAAKTRVQIRSK